jgi:hypothetical protein
MLTDEEQHTRPPGQHGAMRMPKTKRGASRQFNAILNAYRRAFAGGGMFGFDWPTMRINAPDTYAKLHTLRELYPTLPN